MQPDTVPADPGTGIDAKRADTDPAEDAGIAGGETVQHKMLALRLVRYVIERFLGPADLLLLTSLYLAGITAGGLSTALMIADGQITVVGETPIWNKFATSYAGFILYFFHLRVLLDARDSARDRVHYPSRPAARGLVSGGELLLLAMLLLGVETVLVANVGEIRLGVWTVAIAFSFAMRIDFGLGRFMRSRPFARSAAHACAYPLVLAMLVAVAWESTIMFGLFPSIFGLEGIKLPGLTVVDLFTAQPLALGALYVCGLLLACAVEVGTDYETLCRARPRLTPRLHAILPAIGVGSAVWLAYQLFSPVAVWAELGLFVVTLVGGWMLLRRADSGPEFGPRMRRGYPMAVAIVAFGIVGGVGLNELPWLR